MSQSGRGKSKAGAVAGAVAEADAAAVGRLVDCSQADDRRMIALVKERRLLYARNNMPVASYYSQVKKLWEEVADQMDWTVADVRRKWSHIRNSYSRHLRNELHGARTGRGRAVSRWYLADELAFLREHMATDVRPSPYTSYGPSFLDIEQSTSPEQVEVKPIFPNPWLSLGSPKDFDVKTESFPDDSSSSFTADENSSYFQFFRGIYNDYQELPAKKQRLFKRQCLNMLHDLLDAEDTSAPTCVPTLSMCDEDPMNLTAHESEEEREHKPVLGTNGDISILS